MSTAEQGPPSAVCVPSLGAVCVPSLAAAYGLADIHPSDAHYGQIGGGEYVRNSHTAGGQSPAEFRPEREPASRMVR
jgi:hypothetical protein